MPSINNPLNAALNGMQPITCCMRVSDASATSSSWIFAGCHRGTRWRYRRTFLRSEVSSRESFSSSPRLLHDHRKYRVAVGASLNTSVRRNLRAFIFTWERSAVSRYAAIYLRKMLEIKEIRVLCTCRYIHIVTNDANIGSEFSALFGDNICTGRVIKSVRRQTNQKRCNFAQTLIY